MAKVFAGARLRRLREEHGLSQTDLFGVDPAVFVPHDTPQLVSGLREALAGTGSIADLSELATRLPELAEAVIDLHRRYRGVSDQLTELVGDRGQLGRSPHDQV